MLVGKIYAYLVWLHPNNVLQDSSQWITDFLAVGRAFFSSMMSAVVDNEVLVNREPASAA